MTTETANPSQTDASTAFLRAARAGQLDKILALLNQDIDINVSNANGLNAMHLASKDGHAEVVGVLLQRGAHIDAATKKGNTALHIAALAGQETVVRLLVQSGAQVNIQSQNGFTPLYMAAQENHDGVVKFLLANGANQSLATEDGFTPLAVAMQQGHEKVVAVLLEADTGRVRLPALHIAAKKDDCKAAALLLENDHNPDVTSKSGFTPLHIAAHYGNESVAKLLLTKGADVNCAAKHNICPLHVAAKWGKANMVALLAENSGQVDAKTRDGLTPLHCAARSGHEHVVDMLLERGAPISGKSKNGLAPLHMAAQGDHSDAARILLYHRAPVDDLTVDYLTALHVAAHCGHVKVAKLLLDRNADANARALNGFTPLHIACKKNRIKVVELLLKYGASISATTESGLTPLHVAAFMGCMNIVIYLLQHEASPDVPTVRGETPLHLAARANQTDIIRILLRNGAAVDARAREMQTALHIASRLGNVDIVLLLVQHGAQLDALTADNYNALHIAAKQHNHEVAAVLLEHGAPPNAVTKKGFTPLHLAAKYGNLKVATLLMQQRGAELDPRGKNGVTPLHVAAQYKHHAVATALLEKGADPKAAAKNGHTPLHIAARKNQMETAAALMEKGAVVDAESRAGCTPLHLAAHQGHAEMCSLLMEQGAEAGRRARSGLAALHLAAQEDHVPVAKMLVNNGAKVDVCTKGGYTPLHVASHFGQTNMVKFLLESGADVQATTCHGYTALHHAAQQGHINIVNLLLEHKADANATTNNGQTPLDIAQRLGYVTVMDTLKGVSEPSPVPAQAKDDKYRPVAPETMYETFMSDSEEEGGEDTMLTDQPYRYLTVDDMKSLGDDSLPIDVTRDERAESVIGMKNVMEVSQGSAANGPPYVIDEISTVKTVNHLYNAEVMKEGYCYNVDSTQPKRKLQWKNFLVSFLVDARGGAMRGIRGGGVRVIVPPLSAQQPTRITCRYVRAQRVSHMPPLMEGEALASRVLELGPVSAKFIGPIILEVPHYASLRGKEREIVILRSDNGTTWREHALEAADCAVQDILADTLEIEDPPEDPGAPPSRMTRILTHDFPQYFAVISRIRQEVHAIGPEGGMVSSSVVPQVQAVFPQGALTKKIKVGLQAQTIEADLTAKLLGRGVAVSPVVTVEPRRRKFHKAITLSMPAPRPHSQGMINQYTTSAPTLRLLCSISGGTNRAHWEDVTDSTPLTFVNDCVSFTTTVSARYWLMDCRNVSEATKMATELYREAIHVPFMAKFVVYAKRTEHVEAQLRVFCVTDDKEDKTLERMERFSQVAKSRDVEVHEGKPVYLEFGGNFTPVAKSGEQPKLEFRAFKESRLRLGAMVRGSHADAVARCQFMREPKRPKGEPTQPPICVLNILLPEEVFPMDLTLPPYQSKHIATDETFITENNVSVHHEDLESKRQIRLSDTRITSICNLLGMDWVPLAYELGVSSASVGSIRERGNNGAQQAALMLKLWREQGGLKAHDNALELALCRIGREDVLLPQSTADAERRIQRNIYQERQSSEEIVGYKSPDSELFEKDRTGSPILEQEDVNKVLDKDDIQLLETDLLRRQQQKGNKEFSMDDSVGERDEAKYSPEEKSYVGETEEGSDIEPSLTPSEESEEEEGVKKSVAERKIQITRKLSSSKVPSSKQKRELKEEIIEIKKQINPEIKKFHVQQTSVVQQASTESVTKEPVGKLSKKSSEEDEIKKPPSPHIVEQVESPKEKVLPKAGPRHMQKHVRNESMIRFSSGDFSDIQVTQKKPGERITETKVIEETIIKGAIPTSKTEVKKETITTIDGGTKTITTKEETISFEGRDIAEAPLRQKISSFESKMQTEKTTKTEKIETSKFKLTEEALKKHTEGHGTSAEYTEDFIKDQIRSQTEHEEMIYKGPTDLSRDPGSPDLVADFAAELMKAEETFMASADHTADKYTDNYFKGPQPTLPKSFPRAMRTDSTIVQFSSEEDNEYLKKSTDSETEPESQVVTVKQKVGMLEEQISTEKLVNLPISKSKEKIASEAIKSPKLTINIEQELIEEAEDDFLSREVKALEYEAVKVIKETDVDRLRVDSLEDSLQISSDEDAQIQPTDDESESHMKEQLSFETADITTKMTKTQSSDLKTETASDTSQPASIPQTMHDSPRHISQESPLPGWQSTIDKTDSLADSVQSTERDSYVSQSESKVYSKESRPGRSDSLDEASQFSDMEETQIGAAFAAVGAAASQIESAVVAPAPKPALVRADTARFLEQESMFSSGELSDKFKRKPRTPTQEISAKARQFIETVPEDDSSVQDCFFSKRIYSDSLEESEQYGTDTDSRRPSEADSLKSDKSDPSGKDPDFKMPKISSEIEEGLDENIDSSLIDDERLDSDKDYESDVKFEFVKVKSDSKDEDSEGSDRIFDSKKEPSDVAEETLFKKITKRHSRNESVSLTKFSSLELKDGDIAHMTIVPPEIPLRATEFQMFVTEATDDYPDERLSSFEREELSDKISSESSREIEMSEKKSSEGDISNKISSEDGVTDKVSSDSGAQIDDSDLKASSDTLHGAGIKSPDLVMDDEKDDPKTKVSPTEKVDIKLTGRKESNSDTASGISAKLDDSLKGIKRASLGSAGEGGSMELTARTGKRASDAPSLTDSRDYTFEESEDSIPQGRPDKHDIESRAKAILEPIYDKAIRAVRGDSLDDVEPFCLDQDSESPRLPGIEETQTMSDKPDEDETTVKASALASALEGIVSSATTVTSGVVHEIKHLSLAKALSKDGGKDYSVHSSPDEVEEKICTDSESELDQAKVLEIIEPTSEGDVGYVPSFDTTKLKQDSLDDADDFFPEKEMGYDDIYTTTSKQTTTQSSKPGFESSTVTTTVSTVEKSATGTKTVHETSETKIVESTLRTTESLVSKLEDLGSKFETTESSREAAQEHFDSIRNQISVDEDEEDSDYQHHIPSTLSEIGATVAASIGINLMSGDLIKSGTFVRKGSKDTSLDVEPKDGADHKLKMSGSKDSLTKREHSFTELLSDASSTLAASIGINVKSDEREDLLTGTVQPVSKELKHSVEKRDSLITELISDVNTTLAATAGVIYKGDSIDIQHSGDDRPTLKSAGSKDSHEHDVSELIADTSSTLAASIGVDIKLEEKEDRHSEKDHPISTDLKHSIEKQDSIVTELISDVNTTLAATVGVDYKPENIDLDHAVKDHPRLKSVGSKDSHDHEVSELIADVSSTLAASVGIDYKPEELIHHPADLKPSESKESLAKSDVHVSELISDAGSALAASVGIDFKPHEVDFHTDTFHTVTSTTETITHSVQKISETTEKSKTSRESSVESAPVGVPLKFGEEHFLKQESTELDKFELDDTISSSAAKSVKEAISLVESRIEEEGDGTKKSLDDERSPELSMDDVEDGDKLPPGMKDVDRLVRRCSDLLEGISQPDGSIIRIDTSHVTHGLSLKFSKTPPPSPVDLIHREQAGVASIAQLTGQQTKGPDAFPDQTPSKLSPKDIRVLKDHLQLDTDTMHTDLVTEVKTKVLSRSASPKSPTRHHADNISFVNVDALTIHPEPDVKSISPDDTAARDSHTVKQAGKISTETITKTETVTDAQTKVKDFQESQISFKEETRKKFEDMKRDFEDNAIAKFEQMKKEFVGKDITKKTFEDGTTLISTKESVTHQISGKEFFSEKKETVSTDDDIKAKVETKRQISGEEYELKQKESIEKSGDVTHSERSSVERDEKGSAEREDSEIQEAKKMGDDVAVVVTTQREFAEQSLYSGRQSKSEEKMTAIKDDVSKKSEISYSERDLSHEQWGKEYFTERTELEPTEEVEAEFSQGKDVEMVSAVKIVEKDEKITSEELTHEGVVISATKGYSKEESTVESKEHDDLSSDISHDTSFKSEVAGKRGSFDEKSEMSPKSRSKSLKKEEVYEVDFIKEIRVSTSQRDKSLSQGGSLDTQSESDLTGESDFVMQAHQDLPEDLKHDDVSKFKGKTDDNLEKKLSPVHKPEEHIIQEHVWEVSVQQHEPLDEVASEIHLQSKSIRDESRSWDVDFASSSISGSDIGLTTISSDRDVKIRLNGLSLASSEDIHDVEAPSEDFESFKDSMIKSGESVETEYMIQSIDSQDAETLQKSMDSVSADTMQHSEKDDYSLEAESFVPDLHHRRGDHRIVKEKSLEDICSSGYDTDLSSAEFLASKLEHERVDITEPVRPQPLAQLSDLEKTIDEVKQSLEAAHGQIISEKSDSTIKYKQSPSEFEFKLISPDRPEVIQEEPSEAAKSEIIKTDSRPTVTGYIQKQAYASSAELEEQHQVKKDYVELGEELTTKDKSIEITMTDRDIQISVKDSDTSSSKHDDITTITSDDEKETAHERDRPCNTQQEFSDFSTGLESGPISLLDTETELTSDKEESPKGSPEALVKLRPIHKHVKSAHMTAGDRRSTSDVEGWSSSGESHYQSFEHTDSPQSRPLSSDVENLLTGQSTADFHSALTTQDISLRSHKTSKEYYSAVSSISSRDSMRSLDSESSGNLASVDISDASETLVPSATELKEEMMESGNFNEPFETDSAKLKDISIKETEESAEDLEVRQIQMISSLDVVNQPIGSSDHSEEGSLDDEVNAINENSEIISKMKRSHEMSFQPKELLPDKFPSESLSESVDMDLESMMPESDSQVFTMSKIETGPREIRHVKESTEVTSTKSTHSKSKESPKSFEVSEKIVEYHTSSVVYKTPEKKQKPAEIEETVIERKVTTVKTESKPSVITTTVEQQSRDIDFDAMMGEIIPKGSQEYEEIVSCQVLISKSGPSVSGSSSYEKKIAGPYPLDSQQSSSSSLKIQEDHLSTPQTPISNPSQSSESTDNGREYVLDDMYEISEDPELFHSERAMTDSKSEISVTAEERTLYETQKEPDSPSSDEFEMVDKPSEIDDFVVIEEVAKEASEFDAEGKSLSIGKIAMVKKHDEEIEEYLSQTAKKTSETEYSTSGSLSEEEILQYELEQKRLKAAENAEIEAGKKWIQMQFEGDLAAARYDYERGPLEDIKEEEMTDFDASRFGSLTSQKESVGSYGSLKNSYGSLSESEMNLRKRYMMRYGEQDDVSVSSLQEFEHLEQALSMENYQHSSSSQDSLNGSLSRRYHLSKGPQGDDVSVSSLKEFEGLESACLEALKIEINAKQKEALLLSHDGRLSSAGFLDMERRSYSQGSSESSPPQKSGSSPGQKSGSPSQKSSSPSLKSGSPGQKFGSPSQRPVSETTALRKMIDQQMAEGAGDGKGMTSPITDGGTTITYVTAQKKVFDNRGAFYVPDTESGDCGEVICSKKITYECQKGADGEPSICREATEHQSTKDDPQELTELGSSFTELDTNMIGVITTTKVVQKRFIDGKMVSETVTTSTGKGVDIPGAMQEDQSGEFGSGSFHSIDVGSGKSDFSTSMTSQQSDTESLITMMEQQLDSELGSLETLTFSKKVVVTSKPMELDLGSRSSDASDSGLRETSPLSNRSGSGVFSGITSKPFTDPASGSWSGLDEDMSSSGSFSRAKEEDLMLGSTDSLEQTSSNATRATYNYEVDTPMTGSLTSAGSNTMVSSLETLEPLTTVCDKGERTLRLSTEDCFTADHSGSDHMDEYEVQEPDSDLDKQGHSKSHPKERTIRFGSEGSSEETSTGQSGSATFFIGDTPIVRGEKSGEKSGESSATTSETAPPVPAQRKSLTGLTKPISFETGRFKVHGSKEDDGDDEENV